MSATPNQTGIVYGDTLQRKAWALEGLIQEASSSVFDGLKGQTADSIIFISTDASKGAGHEVVFQFDGNVSGAAKVDKERLRGNEEQKKQFSDKIRVRRIRHGLDNGDEFDSIDIGNLALSTQTHSRGLLADWYVRQSDQWIFDCMQGMLNSEGPTHIIRPNDRATIADLISTDTFGYDFLLSLERKMKEGKNFTVGADRRPLKPFKLADGKRKWLLMIDAKQAEDMAADAKLQTLLISGDVRGNDNRLIKGVMGTFRSFIIMEMDTFHGKSASRVIGKSEVEVQGMRTINANGKFTGEVGHDTAGKVASRALILGAGAVQQAFGRQPDYKVSDSEDYGITSGSAMEFWTNVQSTVLYAENGDYESAKVAGMQFGIIAVDTYNSTNV